MSIISLILYPIIFISIISLILPTHERQSAVSKMFCLSGCFFGFGVLNVLSPLFIPLGVALFLLSYMDFFKIGNFYIKIILAFALSLIYLIPSPNVNPAHLIFILLIPELFDFAIYTIAKLTGKKATLVFNNISTELSKNSYMALNICMIFFSFSAYDNKNILAILAICILLNWYFYNKIKKNVKN